MNVNKFASKITFGHGLFEGEHGRTNEQQIFETTAL